eukprot:NODE_698_length_5079_cov_0.796586.p1 type:complete len:375 gc:universal NODE_698_length_5079_cov_0.796586:1298-2422(+)
MLGKLHLEAVHDPSKRYENCQILTNAIYKLSKQPKDAAFESFWAKCKVSSSTINTELLIQQNCYKLMNLEYEIQLKDPEQIKQFLQLVAEYNKMHFYDYEEQYLISSEIIVIEVSHVTNNVALQFTNNLDFSTKLNDAMSFLLSEHPAVFNKAVEYLCFLELNNQIESWFSFLNSWGLSDVFVHWIGPSFELGLTHFAYLTKQDSIALHFNKQLAVPQDVVDLLSKTLLSETSTEITFSEQNMSDLIWHYLSCNIHNVSDMPIISKLNYSMLCGILESSTTPDLIYKFTLKRAEQAQFVVASLNMFVLFKEFCSLLFQGAYLGESSSSTLDISSPGILITSGANKYIVEFGDAIYVNSKKCSSIEQVQVELNFK